MLPYKCAPHELVEYVAKEVGDYFSVDATYFIKGSYKNPSLSVKIFLAILTEYMGYEAMHDLFGCTYAQLRRYDGFEPKHMALIYNINYNIKTINKAA